MFARAILGELVQMLCIQLFIRNDAKFSPSSEAREARCIELHGTSTFDALKAIVEAFPHASRPTTEFEYASTMLQ